MVVRLLPLESVSLLHLRWRVVRTDGSTLGTRRVFPTRVGELSVPTIVVVTVGNERRAVLIDGIVAAIVGPLIYAWTDITGLTEYDLTQLTGGGAFSPTAVDSRSRPQHDRDTAVTQEVEKR